MRRPFSSRPAPPPSGRLRSDITLADDRLQVIAGAVHCLAERSDLSHAARRAGIRALKAAYARLKQRSA
ncbi:MAG TPA: hypothetical protein VF234_07115 [Limnochordia bacterium]